MPSFRCTDTAKLPLASPQIRREVRIELPALNRIGLEPSSLVVMAAAKARLVESWYVSYVLRTTGTR